MEAGNADIERSFHLDCGADCFGADFWQNARRAFWNKAGDIFDFCRTGISDHLFRYLESYERLYEKIKDTEDKK